MSSSQPFAIGSEYDTFASLYDRHMAAEFAARVLPVLDRLLLDRLEPGAAVLDVCCGSGRVSAGLLARGFQVTAIDASGAMLALAQRTARGADFICADISGVELPRRFAAALSTFNSLAHVYTLEDLTRAFSSVRRSLTAGGMWLFDLTSEEAYVARWHGSFVMLDGRECGIVRPSYDRASKMARNDVTVFERNGSEIWRRSDIRIFQKCYTAEEVRRALIDAGFLSVATYDAGAIGMTGERGRTFFLAQLP
jgi:SAM-dependent methyltransferase